MDGKHIIHGLPRGFSDLFGIIPAHKTKSGFATPVFIETKVRPNKPTQEQIQFLQERSAEGCAACVAYTLADAWEIIEPLLKPEFRVYSRQALEKWDKIK